MKRVYEHEELLITGLGITTPIGQGAYDVTSAMLAGEQNFSLMKREGRQYIDCEGKSSQFIGAEISFLKIPESICQKTIRTASFSTKVALTVIHEAWMDAKLDQLESDRIGLVVGGSNFQQREQILKHEKYAGRQAFLNPIYAMAFMDTDLCALASEVFGIKGMANTVGAASASGQVAIIQAAAAVNAGLVDACIVVGALMDLSYWECQAFTSAGAMGSFNFANLPNLASRPFDKNRDGFIYGENCGAIVIERASSAKRCVDSPYAKIAGWGLSLDANRHPNPCSEGQKIATRKALDMASLNPEQIDYINTHGTGSKVGDETEIRTIHDSGLSHAWLNTSKSIVGHGLSAAGTVETVLILLQMKAQKLHPCMNLKEPICDRAKFVPSEAIEHSIKHALNLSFGFGGVSSALCLMSL